jgi:tetratricopeptide (TPR) repeat protein
MKGNPFLRFPVFLPLLIFLGCAATTPPPGDSPVIPLGKANLEAVLEEQEGLEIIWVDAKELRDFYRGGVQKKAAADKKFQEKNYPEALKLYDASDEFFQVVLKYSNEDVLEFPLFEGANILFFPNLLIADNHLKTGQILREMGRESSARREWKQALPFIKQSLRSEHTEWGLSLRQEVLSLLDSKGR